jgi:hypothetical protein
LFIGAYARRFAYAKRPKVFWFFFSKKNVRPSAERQPTMRHLALAVTITTLLTPAAAFAYADPALQAQAFIGAFDKGDTKAAAETMLPSGVTIIDEFAPYLWQGPTAFADWARDLETSGKAAGMDNEAVILGTPTRRDMVGKTAYVVTPATFSFTLHGKKMTEAAQMTFAMKYTDAGWKIAAWTWTGPAAVPAP